MPGNPSGVSGAPNRYNIFGTNQQGFDVFAQMVHGTQIALSVGFISMGIAAAIGITVGALAGYLGGWVDAVVMRMVDALKSTTSRAHGFGMRYLPLRRSVAMRRIEHSRDWARRNHQAHR